MVNLTKGDLLIGEKIHFIIDNKSFFEGHITNIYENCFAVNIFTGQNSYRPINAKEKIKFIIVSRSEAFNCSSSVLGCKLGDKFEIALLTMPEVVNSIERRRYPRVQVVMPAEYYMLPTGVEYNVIDDVSLAYHRQMKKTFTVDISGNGIKLITYDNNSDSEYALISLHIEEEIKILCSVVRREIDEKNNKCKTAFQFKDIDNTKWNIINKFVNERMQK